MITTTIPQVLADAKNRLDRRLIEHPRFEDSLSRIMSEIQFPTDTKLLLVVGPTGVGKTRLREKVESKILQMAAAKDPALSGSVPCVSFEVPSVASNHRFSWREFYHAYMAHLNAPFAMEPSKLAAIPLDSWSKSPEQAVLNALKYRRPNVVLLDEANHFASVSSGKVLLEQMTRIKSFANRSGVLHVCFGTYELMQMASLSGQLARRCDIVHFGRYRAGVGHEADFADFKTLLRTFQKCLGVAPQLEMSTLASYFHERSIGCAGTLKTWLMKALAHAARSGRTEIVHQDLKATELSVDKLRRMLDEAGQGERFLTESQDELDLLREDLGLVNVPPKAKPGIKGQFDLPLHDPSGAGQAKNKLKPGQQLPRRYPIGGDDEGATQQKAS